VIILMFGPISGAHFNPAVTFAFLLRGEIGAATTLGFVLAQAAGGLSGTWKQARGIARPMRSTTHPQGGDEGISERPTEG
jgi:glycerol uptake facilitator-like aquaporin